jgi:hypothetical protein
VAVRAQKVTFRGFGDQSLPGSAEVPETELLRLRIPVVKLKRGDAGVIGAVLTPPAPEFDQTPLALYAPPSLTAVRRSVPPLSSGDVGLRPSPDRSLRRVVLSKRGA